ncbi:S-methyl-5'-thioadenosine phosphorylase [Hyphobacterium marinum]|uniref:S-methyl-5'-thioadenosine phosphorylase n=1 Tax=Hyphobacterium marinum TaxID=3116574 RepID=A0ABU7LX80_9PROT|nr:S-methyl-5'-thioadenosine phosphorylase [Hyphobacterium sp. Y6023]MEE2566148.1 S-methyl-5'-thioadenosine phosphorylase [Hyphobacterium sp. Y6023]
MTGWTLGIIGGSGLYDLQGLDGPETVTDTPWGKPSAPVRTGKLAGVPVCFIPRHGPGHVLSPDAINYRANIDALKRAGATDILSLSACGSLREHMAPGDFVVVDQYVDRTKGRASSFFGPGCVAHVPMADPVCSRLSSMVADAGEAAGARVHQGGTYLAMEGPQFSTRAESRLYREWGCDVIGMTNMPEARLAREAELPYASVAMVTDYDSWRAGGEDVDVPSILKVMQANAAKARKLVESLAEAMAASPRTPSPDGIESILDIAIVTPPAARDTVLMGKLDAVARRVLGA